MLLEQRRPRIEDPAWLALVRNMPCLVCGYPRSDPAHIRTGARQYGKRQCGMQEKPDDCWVLPLCRKDHTEQHRNNEMAWWASKGIPDPHAVAIALYAARPATLWPLPAPAPKARKVRSRKAKAQRRQIVGKTEIPQRANPWPEKGTRKLPSRAKERSLT
jgi:hypothetical protein